MTIVARVGPQPERDFSPYSTYSYRTAHDEAFAAYVRARPEVTEQIRAFLRAREFMQVYELLIRTYEQYQAEAAPSS